MNMFSVFSGDAECSSINFSEYSDCPAAAVLASSFPDQVKLHSLNSSFKRFPPAYQI
jgi:hypothetical protein